MLTVEAGSYVVEGRGFEPPTSGVRFQRSPTELAPHRLCIIGTCAIRCNPDLTDCARNCARELSGRLLEVGGADDVVAVEDIPRLVPRDSHRHRLGDAHVDHVPHGGPSEIVAEPAWHSRFLAGRGPRLAEIPRTADLNELWIQLLTVAEVPQRLLAPNSTHREAARNKVCRHFLRFGLMISSTHVKAATAVGNPEVVTASSTTCSISFGVAPTSSAR